MTKKYARAKAGEKSGRLTLVRFFERLPTGYRWLAKCDCGNETVLRLGEFRNGKTKSCGCWFRETRATAHRTHGGCGTPEYRIWNHLTQRCNNPSDKTFVHYGARGIRVCKRWGRFETFLADMGQRPSPKHSIDRINNDGDYTPSNCRWATRVQQQQNTSRNVYVLVHGDKLVLAEAERRLGICRGGMYTRFFNKKETYQQVANHFAATRRYIAPSESV